MRRRFGTPQAFAAVVAIRELPRMTYAIPYELDQAMLPQVVIFEYELLAN
jgi:hypothetical protein